jgi:serine protease Do
MNSISSPLFSGRRKVWSTAGLVAASGLAMSVVAWAAGDQGKTQVTVKVDEQPLARSGVGESASYSPVIKQVAPSVVRVNVIERAKNVPAQELPPFFNDPQFRQFFGNPNGFGEGQGQERGGRRMQRQPEMQGLGSGVIVSADGYVLTNNHVVNGADVIKVSLNDGRELTAKVVGTDPKSDLAVIKVDAKDLPFITFTDSDKIEVGDKVLAIGNPFGIGQSVTSGMVSALGRATMGLDYGQLWWCSDRCEGPPRRHQHGDLQPVRWIPGNRFRDPGQSCPQCDGATRGQWQSGAWLPRCFIADDR